MEAILLREFARDTRFISWQACQWPVTRIFPLLGVLLNLIALSACISASEVSPKGGKAQTPSPPSQTHVTFQIEPYGSGQSQDAFSTNRDHGGAPGIRKVFEESFAGATYVLTPRPMGTHVRIEALRKSLSLSAWWALAQMSLFALPWYHEGSGYVVLYDLYLDGKLQRTYRYEITEKGIVWLPLLLFTWVNYFTTGETEAFEETARQFVADAERDGYVRAPSP